jgi:hypothetical protein
MSVEASVSLFSAWRARSPALLAFGGDSAVELLSAVVVLWRFRASAGHERVEKQAARVAGTLLFALAAFVAVTSVASLLGHSEPKPTFLGIAILVAAAAVMPWLVAQGLDPTAFPQFPRSPANLAGVEGFLFGGFEALPNYVVRHSDVDAETAELLFHLHDFKLRWPSPLSRRGREAK